MPDLSGPIRVQFEDETIDLAQWFAAQAKLLGNEATPSQDYRYFYMTRDFGGVKLTLMIPVFKVCSSRTETDTVNVPKEVKRVIYECGYEVKALGFTDPGEFQITE